MTSPSFGRAVMIATLLAMATTPVAAQLRMPRIGNAVARTVAPGIGEAKIGVVTFDDAVLEINADRLASLQRGLEAEQAMASRVDAQDMARIEQAREAANARYAQQRAAYDAALERHESCSNREVERSRPQVAAIAPGPLEQQQLEAVAKRIQAARDAGNMAEVMRLADSLGRIGTRTAQGVTAISTETQQRIATSCGTRPVAPERPVHATVLTYEDIVRAGHQASGLAPQAYRILRERVAPLVLGQSPGGLVYQPGELSAIRTAMPSLKPYADLMQRY